MREIDWYNVAVLGDMYVKAIHIPYGLEISFTFTTDIKRAKHLSDANISLIKKHLRKADIRMVKVELV